VGGRMQVGGHLGLDLGFSMAGGELLISEAHKDQPRVKAQGGRLTVVAKGKKAS